MVADICFVRRNGRVAACPHPSGRLAAFYLEAEPGVPCVWCWGPNVQEGDDSSHNVTYARITEELILVGVEDDFDVWRYAMMEQGWVFMEDRETVKGNPLDPLPTETLMMGDVEVPIIPIDVLTRLRTQLVMPLPVIIGENIAAVYYQQVCISVDEKFSQLVQLLGLERTIARRRQQQFK